MGVTRLATAGVVMRDVAETLEMQVAYSKVNFQNHVGFECRGIPY